MQGAIFSVIGMGAGITGTTLSNGLLALRKRLDPEFESPNKPPNVLKNAGTWATHMGVSSNFRYQAINGFDMVGPGLGAKRVFNQWSCMHQLSATFRLCWSCHGASSCINGAMLITTLGHKALGFLIKPGQTSCGDAASL